MHSPMFDGDPEKAKLLIVAMSPGEEELDQDKPLVGPTGHMIWTWLGKVGIHRPDCLIVNCIGELPEGAGGKTITPEQYDRYWDQFDDLCKRYKGKVALVLGGDALWRFCGFSDGIEAWRGYVVEPNEGHSIIRNRTVMGVYKSGPKKGQPKKERKKEAAESGIALCPNLKVVIPTLHPSGVMRQGNTTLPALVADLNRAVEATGNVEVILAFASDPAHNLGEFSEPTRLVVYDVEGYDYITHAGVCTENSYPWSWEWNLGVKNRMADLLGMPDIVKVAHNQPFDQKMFAQEDIEIVGPYADTMLMAAMVEPDMPKGLKYVVPMYFTTKRWDHKSDTDIIKYNAMDVWHTRNLYYKLKNILEVRGQWDLFMGTIMPCVPTLMEMSNVGLYVDDKRRREWIDKLRADLLALDRKWRELTGNVGWSRHKELKAYLKDKLGLEIKYSKNGGQTLDENAVREHILEHPEHKEVLELLLKMREVSKELGTYATIDITSDHTVHPSYLPAGKDDDRYDEDGEKAGKGLAGTWRPTAKKPNIQNQTPEARKMFIPRVPGHVFVEMDFNSFEARILAWLSDDMELLYAIEKDLHGINAEKLNVDRTRAKNGFYGWSYGAGAKTLQRAFRSKGYNVSFAECKALLAGFNKAYPAAARYRDSVITVAKESRVVTNPFGLKRYFYARDVGTAPANTVIQSTAAIIMWKILPQLAAEAKRQGGMMVAMVHDSVEFELPPNFDPKPFKAIMEQKFPEVAPAFYCPIDIKIGPSWGEVTKYGHQAEAA